METSEKKVKQKFFSYSNYKNLIIELIESRPKKGRGQYKKIAEFFNISSVAISQVFKGEKDLTVEQGFKLCHFFGFNELETEYFLLLVQIARAGSFEYREKLEKDLLTVRARSSDVAERVRPNQKLTQKMQSEFYSSWIYSAIRLSTDLEKIKSIEDIVSHFGIGHQTATEIINFLLDSGLCKLDGSELTIGPSKTHVRSNSPFVKRHHLNWRMKAIAHIDSVDKKDLHYTGPMTLSYQSFERIREILLKTIEETTQVVVDSDSEKLACLNIDWFKF